MAEDKRAPEQNASEDSREVVERELQRLAENEKERASTRKDHSSKDDGEKIAIPMPVEPGDQNAQTTPPSL